MALSQFPGARRMRVSAESVGRDDRGHARRRFLRGATVAAAGGFLAAELPGEARAEPVQGVITQSAEHANTSIFSVVPATEGAAPFQVQMNSYANPGAGAGTYNRGVWFGWNAGGFASGPRTTGKQSVYMGFEDNYFDAGGDESYGVEWYVGYSTPDGTTIGPADLRPFYFRVKGSDANTSEKSVVVAIDIGSGTSGSFAVMGDVLTKNQLFSITKEEIYARLRMRFTAPGGGIQIKPTIGYAGLELVAPGGGPGGRYGVIAWRDGPTPIWSIAGTAGIWSVRDATNQDRNHLFLTPGTSDITALTTLQSSLYVKGKLGVNGATPKARFASIPSPATQSSSYTQADAQSIVKAVNSIRKVLYDFGLTD